MAGVTGTAVLFAGGLAVLWGSYFASEAAAVRRNLRVTGWLLVTIVVGGGVVLLGTSVTYGVAGWSVWLLAAVCPVVGVACGSYAGLSKARRAGPRTQAGEHEANDGDPFDGTAFEPATDHDETTRTDT